jgi:pimeloyl-ACP methyl ester carboxylesterase
MVSKISNIVLVHGAFVDGSGWEGVYKLLKPAGYQVSVVQNATVSLNEDVAATKLALAGLDGPALLVGHSYGGAVITEAGNDPRVNGLVYIAGFAPDEGESIDGLLTKAAPETAKSAILPPQNGRVFLDKAKFQAAFAGDVDPEKAMFMADSQTGWGTDAVGAVISKPAWKNKPSWYLVTTDDQMIPPAAQRMMAKRAGATTVEEKGSHSIFVSKPEAVAALIEKAASNVRAAAA